VSTRAFNTQIRQMRSTFIGTTNGAAQVLSMRSCPGLRRFRANYAMSGEGRLVMCPDGGEIRPRRISLPLDASNRRLSAIAAHRQERSVYLERTRHSHARSHRSAFAGFGVARRLVRRRNHRAALAKASQRRSMSKKSCLSPGSVWAAAFRAHSSACS
jgi:hypothetical protein